MDNIVCRCSPEEGRVCWKGYLKKGFSEHSSFAIYVYHETIFYIHWIWTGGGAFV